MSTLSEKSKKVREVKGWSQKRLAYEIGTTQTEISFLERGFTPPHKDRIERLEKLYADIRSEL